MNEVGGPDGALPDSHGEEGSAGAPHVLGPFGITVFVIVVVLGLFTWAWAVARDSVGAEWALWLGSGWGVLWLSFALRIPPFGWIESRLEARMETGAPDDMAASPDGTPPEEMGMEGRLAFALFLAAQATLVSVYVLALPFMRILLACVALLAVASVVAARVRDRIVGAVTARVAEAGRPHTGRADDDAAGAEDENSGIGGTVAPTAGSPRSWTPLDMESLPVPSPAARERQDEIQLRPDSVLFGHLRVLLPFALTVLVLTFWASANIFSAPVRLRPTPLFVAFVLTGLLTTRRGGRVSRRVTLGLGFFVLIFLLGGSGDADSDDEGGDPPPGSIRPIGPFILGGLWMALALFTAKTFAVAGATALAAVSWAAVAAYLIALPCSLRAVEAEHAYDAPYGLLALRVFGGDESHGLRSISEKWSYLGTWYSLHGPDTVGRTIREAVTFFRRGVGELVVEDRAELSDALEGLKERPTRQLRFPSGSIQCNDATWKPAVDALLDRSDVVIMDLGGLTADRGGIAWEIGRVIEYVPLERVVFLVRASTDLATFDAAFERGWAARTDASPNTGLPPMGPRILDLDAFDAVQRERDEAARLANEQVVGMLQDCARPRRHGRAADPVRDRAVMRWAVPGIHGARLAMTVAAWTVLSWAVVRGSLVLIG